MSEMRRARDWYVVPCCCLLTYSLCRKTDSGQISCVKASQGFDWNQEIFLPSYADYTFDDLERRQDPVEDIIVTEEEVRNMLPS